MASIKANPNFNVQEACKTLYGAMKGIGTNEKKLIQVLTSHNNDQRQQIKQKYKEMYNRDLKDHIRSETKEEFQEALVNLLYTPTELDARTLYSCMRFFGTKPMPIIEILASRSNQEMRAIREEYKKKYGKELDEDLAGDFSGPLENLLRKLEDADRPEDSRVDAAQAAQDAQSLYDAGEGQFGTNENVIIDILVDRSYAQLRLTFQEYERIAGKDICKGIKGETEGPFEDALIAIVECIKDAPTFFAKQLHDAFDGLGSKDSTIIRVLISRSEIDLETIKQRYNVIYNPNLYTRLTLETGDDLEDLLQAIVKK